jgi:hypothetical protein
VLVGEAEAGYASDELENVLDIRSSSAMVAIVASAIS